MQFVRDFPHSRGDGVNVSAVNPPVRDKQTRKSGSKCIVA